jgi:hypothetical protein
MRIIGFLDEVEVKKGAGRAVHGTLAVFAFGFLRKQEYYSPEK